MFVGGVSVEIRQLVCVEDRPRRHHHLEGHQAGTQQGFISVLAKFGGCIAFIYWLFMM